MNTNDTNRQKAHAMIDHIFKDLLPAQGMVERSEQIKLSHRMLDTMLNGGIALCESETGIVLPAEAGGLTLKKQYKYGRVLLRRYPKPMQNTDPAENEPKGEAL